MDVLRPESGPAGQTSSAWDAPGATHEFAQGGLWRALSEDTECRVVLLSLEGTILAMNERAERMLSARIRPRIGSPYLECFPPKIRPRIQLVLRRVIDEHGARAGAPQVNRYLVGGYQSISRSRIVELPDGTRAILIVARTLDAPVIVEQVIEQVEDRDTRSDVLGELAALSDRELEVAMLIAAGMSDEEIAGALSRSVRTVHSHRRMIGRRLRLKTRAEIVRLFVERGLVAEPPGGVSAQVARFRPPTLVGNPPPFSSEGPRASE